MTGRESVDWPSDTIYCSRTAKSSIPAASFAVVAIRAPLSDGKNFDILVNNAAGSGSGALSELTDEDWLRHLDVKLIGYVRCAREVIPHMKQKNWGRIVNIGGAAAAAMRREP